jgi:hypothetical protein
MMTSDPYSEPTLRQLLDDSADAVARPGRYCDRMAYVIDVACDPTGDDEVSMGIFGDYAVRFGRRVLVVDGQGFVSAVRYASVDEASAAMDELRDEFRGSDDDDDDDC